MYPGHAASMIKAAIRSS